MPLPGRARVPAAFAEAAASGEEPETSGRTNLGSVALAAAAAGTDAGGAEQLRARPQCVSWGGLSFAPAVTG